MVNAYGLHRTGDHFAVPLPQSPEETGMRLTSQRDKLTHSKSSGICPVRQHYPDRKCEFMF